jgi:hypothetical protein
MLHSPAPYTGFARRSNQVNIPALPGTRNPPCYSKLG